MGARGVARQGIGRRFLGWFWGQRDAAESAMALDETSVVGVENITSRGAQVNLTSREANDRNFLSSGQSLAYRSAAGSSCKVALLSIGGRGESVSFANSCAG